MSADTPATLTPEDIDAYLAAQEQKDLLRFITCGSVDDGKSTLIGRLLYDSKLIFEDQLTALEADSKRDGTVKDGLDFALLVDGLQAEREQGITIDVAYRFFATDKRKFIVADTPGHEQYTRNMATGASTASAAVILIDARRGVLTQTRRHSFIVSLLGIKTILLAVNKMDLVNYDQDVFDRIVAEYRSFAAQLSGNQTISAIPLSALKGDNLMTPSTSMPWYDGPTLLNCLESAPLPEDQPGGSFRMPVQWVNRPSLDFRGFSGTVSGGPVHQGQHVIALPSGKPSTIARIVTLDGDLDRAQPGQAITLTLADEIDVSRGDILCDAEQPASVTDQFAAHVIWMADAPMIPERQYILKLGTQTVGAAITELKHKINVNTLEHNAAKTLDLNEVALCNLALDQAITYDPYTDNPQTGAFILIDRYTNATVGAGMISFGLRRATNLVWQELDVTKQVRAELKRQKPAILWFTGLSGAGKSTVANLVEKHLLAIGRHTYILDGDNVRHGLNKDLGFTETDRVENIRRVAETAKLFVDAGLITLVSFISPFRSERDLARDLVEEDEFLEIFVDTPLAVCETRDPKGLYAKARAGQIKNFTGIDSPYEAPVNPELRLDTTTGTPAELAEQVIGFLKQKGFI
ncbi:MAG: adenylyl-sulfate kinase [Rhodospirillaceae bacterium]|jgi:bifunctional enzyme CysN/CysC|uniref:sulfate adenylyltransferase subunit CysN n=1 Tax=unclassified Hwanghaeella TaxID=2605944 RepID=UPI000C4EEEB7|nr:adenylyl-sulfate kinase [Rhodospirillales bacterium]MAX47883.1 adenylyl-sulfate kinase [Rhodospirillaceae bacterium]|tara:strand:+ start:206525 stop:208432 length:1908 start_codon:yes stop_codon:yes gene_type:complete